MLASREAARLKQEFLEKEKKRNEEDREMEKQYRVIAEFERKAIEGALPAAKQREKEESEFEKSISKVDKERELCLAQCHQEEKLAQKLSQLKHDEIVELKTRQKLRESSHELRELERQLNTAYTTKELLAQLAEKRAAEVEEKIHKKKVADLLNDAWKRDEELYLLKEGSSNEKKEQYKQELDKQMQYMDKLKEDAWCRFMEDKRLIDEATLKIQQEDQLAVEKQMEKMKRAHEEMLAFKKEREEWLKKEREAIEDENRRLLEYMRQKEQSEEEAKKAADEKEKQRELLTEKLARKMLAEERAKQEREEILQNLAEEQERLSHQRKEQIEAEKILRQRIEAQQVMKEQAAARMEKLRREAEEDEYFKQIFMEQLAENKKLEQMTAEKQRIKKMEMRREADRALQERRSRRAEEIQLLHRLYEKELEEEENRLKMVEEERLKLLKEHAENLLGFLPPGVVRLDDLPHLGSGFVEKFKALNTGNFNCE